MGDSKTGENNKVATELSDEELREKIKELQKKIPDKLNLSPYSALLNEALDRAEEVINSRPKTNLDTAAKLVTGNVADVATKISNQQLQDGLKDIESFIEKPDDDGNLTEILKLHDQLPSSAYKTVINRIYTAALFVALATSTMFFPPLIPFTAPILGGIALSAGALLMNAVAGMSVHRGLKAAVELTNQSLYERERMKLLVALRKLDKKISDDLGNKTLTEKSELFKEQLKNIEDSRKAPDSNYLPAIHALNAAFDDETQTYTNDLINDKITKAKASYAKTGTLNNNLGFSTPISSIVAYLGFGAFVDKLDALSVTHPKTVQNFKIAMTIAIPAVVGLAALKLPGLFLTTLCNVTSGVLASISYEKLGGEKIEKAATQKFDVFKQKFMVACKNQSQAEPSSIQNNPQQL
jgi:hypothetical protein